jgi:hypothetical protein
LLAATLEAARACMPRADRTEPEAVSGEGSGGRPTNPKPRRWTANLLPTSRPPSQSFAGFSAASIGASDAMRNVCSCPPVSLLGSYGITASCLRMLVHLLTAPTAPVFDERMRGSISCDLICAGCSNADVAVVLVLSPNRPRLCLQHLHEAACRRPGPGDRQGAREPART